MRRIIGVSLFLFCVLIVSGCVENAVNAKTYTNPVWPSDYPDPAVLRVADGTFYVYSTVGRLDGKQCNIRVMKSRDLVSWEPVGDAIPEVGSFNSLTSSHWAPHVTEYKGMFYLYYSTNLDKWTKENKQGMGIAVAVSDSPEGPFITTEEPLVYGDGFEHIDPMLFIDSKTSRKYLYWGSHHKPIHVREMDDDMIHFKEGSEQMDVWPCNWDRDYEKLLEGPWIIEKSGKYYMFTSGDNCCGEGAHYAIMVARSDDPMGPFVTMGEALGLDDSVVMEFNERWLAPGHNAVVTDDAGDEWLVYHAYDLEKKRLGQDGKRKLAGREMLIDKIVWENGWPKKIEPSYIEMPVPVIKK